MAKGTVNGEPHHLLIPAVLRPDSRLCAWHAVSILQYCSSSSM
jgi:hypothetical protein